MAQTIIGLDIGSYSVKVATLSASFRSLAWTGFREYEIPHSERDRPERSAAEVLTEVAKYVGDTSSVLIGSVPGDRVMTRFLTLPFKDPKRVESVLGFELEGQIPLGVEDIVYGYQVLGGDSGGEGTDIFAAAVRRDFLGDYIADLQEKGLDPRALTLDSSAYLNLYDHVARGETVAFLDIGHRTSNLCIIQNGRLRLARSIGRGGMAVTQALSEALELSFEDAEDLKHRDAGLPGGSEPIAAAVADATERAMAPLLIAVRQSLQTLSVGASAGVEKVLLTGGGARLNNIFPWLEDRLGVPVEPLDVGSLPFARVDKVKASMVAGKALSLALLQARASEHVATLNFRRGPFAFQGDFQFLRDKLPYLAAMVALVLTAAVAYAVVRNNGLRHELDVQRNQLAEFTQSNLDTRYTNFKKALDRVRSAEVEDDDLDAIPPMTAIAVFDRLTEVQRTLNDAARRRVAAAPGAPPRPMTLRVDRLRTVAPGLDRRPSLRPRPRPGSPAAGRCAAPSPAGGVRPRFVPPVRAAPGGAPEPADPSRPPSTDLGDPDAPDAPTGPDAEDKRPKRKAFQFELREVMIDVFGKSWIIVETDSSNVDGDRVFQQALAQIPCFQEVERKDEDPVVNERHRDWKKFKVEWSVRCPKSDSDAAAEPKPKSKSEPRKPDRPPPRKTPAAEPRAVAP